MAKAPTTAENPEVEGKDLTTSQKSNNDVEIGTLETATIDPATGEAPPSSENEAEINKRVGPQVQGQTVHGVEFPIPEDRKPSVMPADQQK